MTPPVVLVVAMAGSGAIGRANALPWRLPEDLQRFRALTMGHAVVMGRKTWESIGRSLPGRTNIVISRDRGWHGAGAQTVDGLPAALHVAGAAHPGQTAMVIGGAQIYGLALPLATCIHATEIDLDVEEADAFFPALDPVRWHRIRESERAVSNGLGYRFVDYARRA